MEILRTPEEWFDEVEDLPFERRYLEIPVDMSTDLRVHYVDEGQRDAPVVLLLHGEATWSYLWRKVIPPLVEAGLRVVAPDLPGFGRSAKPAEAERYSFVTITHWARLFAIFKLELENLTLVGHGLGGLIALSLASAHWMIVDRVVTVSTPWFSGVEALGSFSAVDYAAETHASSVGAFVQKHTESELSPTVLAAYEAPFRLHQHRVGIGASLLRGDPMGNALFELIPALRADIDRLEVKTLSAVGDRDRLAGGAASQPNAKHQKVAGAGHFVPEDKPGELAEIILEFIAEPNG